MRRRALCPASCATAIVKVGQLLVAVRPGADTTVLKRFEEGTALGQEEATKVG